MSNETKSRAEHVRWCKQRAREYLASGDAANAVASMLSDLGKHAETRGIAETMGMIGIFSAQSIYEARRFVEGFAE